MYPSQEWSFATDEKAGRDSRPPTQLPRRDSSSPRRTRDRSPMTCRRLLSAHRRHKDTRSELEQALSTQNRYLKQLLDIEKERSLVETEIAEVQENIDRRKALIHDFTSATESDSKRPDKEPSEPTDNLTIMSDEALDTVVFSRQSPEEPYQQPGVGTTSFSPPSTVQTADSRNPISRILSNSSTKNKTNEERLRRANLDISTLPAEIDLAYENWQKRALVLSELKHLHRRVEVRYQETVSDVIWEATRDSQA
ncbi:hypothetical protein L202_05109 [Cryptococcus amylolentus CBS 6039]|uniref:Uncharacterized protein n=1 Tax=Cryptococcus amylolentus CBS 6039 TaxID=1295533 RepID=A0A1E3HPF1_9TREE|nr:hypothetical protein L202_05109 [Cryptococcus amylolentus CBS 6039]ODN78025.1 hypothetical protein L202_05109 [Cryptococcus amylolentus CBS 6039]